MPRIKLTKSAIDALSTPSSDVVYWVTNSGLIVDNVDLGDGTNQLTNSGRINAVVTAAAATTRRRTLARSSFSQWRRSRNSFKSVAMAYSTIFPMAKPINALIRAPAVSLGTLSAAARKMKPGTTIVSVIS
jgi:hypothetical protein